VRNNPYVSGGKIPFDPNINVIDFKIIDLKVIDFKIIHFIIMDSLLIGFKIIDSLIIDLIQIFTAHSEYQ